MCRSARVGAECCARCTDTDSPRFPFPRHSAKLSSIMYRVRKWRRLALSITAILIAAQLGASFLARAHSVHSYLIAHLERAFGRTVKVRDFNFSLLPTPPLNAEQVSIGEDAAFGNEYFLRAERLTAGLRWSGLLRGHFEFGTLSLSRPSLILVPNARGGGTLNPCRPPPKPLLGPA